MLMPKQLMILAIAPFILIPAAGIIAMKINLEPQLTPNELKVLEFTEDEIGLTERETSAIKRALRSPMEIVTKETEAPLVTTKEEDKIDLKISMIVITKRGGMAIVNGMVVSVGDSVEGLKIARIEKNRILLDDNRGKRWIYIEGK